jgi:NodT family efflux transporter outer membrane factor (OMF) lipoprotein
MLWRPLFLTCAFLSAACTVGPDYVKPQPDVGDVFPSASSASTTADVPAAWWRGLGDDRLSAAVEKAMAANTDIARAEARVEQSRAALAGIAALQLPIGEAGAAAGRGGLSREGPAGQLLDELHAPRQGDLYAGVLSLGWETDLFGGLKRAREARSALLDSEIDKVAAVKVVVAAETARAYVLLRGLQLRQANLDHRVALAARALSLSQHRLAVGEGSGLAVHAAEARLAALKAARPALDAALARTVNALDVLQGGRLGDSRGLLADKPVLPVQLAARELDAPAVTVARRPDVAAAERAVAAANAGIGVALAEYYPSLQLGVLGGLSATQIGHFLDSDAGLWAGGGLVQWRLLDWNRIGADVAAARGRKAEALAAYRGTALAAAAEIDTALAALSASAEQARRSDDLARALARTAEIAGRAQSVGEAGLAATLAADDQHLAAQDTLIQARMVALESGIDLYRALGGLG